MKKIVLTIGLFDKDQKKQLVDSLKAYQLIEKAVLSAGAYGATIWDCNGVYLHEDGTLVKEPSVSVAVVTDEGSEFLKNLNSLISFLKKELNQESIMLEQSTININFK